MAPNTTDDEQFLVEAVPDLKERTDLDALWTDGGCTGPDAEDALREEQEGDIVGLPVKGACHLTAGDVPQLDRLIGEGNGEQ